MTEPLRGPGEPEVSVLIVNFESTELLGDCLAALESSTVAADTQVIVVDNATPGFDAAALAEDHPEVEFLPQDRNTTFTGGNNIAFTKATGRFVLMLNPDTRVEPGTVERAIAHLDSDPSLVALGAYFTDERGEFRPYYRRLPRLRDVPVAVIPRLLDWTPMARRYRMANESFDGSTSVEQPAGAFLFMRRSACPEPLLDPRYFNFYSDVELCRHLLKLGEIRVEHDVRCYHARGGAGLVTNEPAVRSRLHQDGIWGLRHYFRGVGALGRAWIELWLLAFWAMRLIQGAGAGRDALRATWTAALASMRGQPPRFDLDARA